MPPSPIVSSPIQEVRIHRFRSTDGVLLGTPDVDRLAVERPLEIRTHAPRVPGAATPAAHERRRLAVTMRTPGERLRPGEEEPDVELATGFLFAEGILRRRADLVGWTTGPDWVELALAGESAEAAGRDAAERKFTISSSCGVCGKGTVESVWEAAPYGDWNGPGRGPFVTPALVVDLPRRLREAQATFAATGGLHASGLFSAAGELLCAREDVGRHNALDKIVGRAFLADRLPLSDTILAVSGRLSFELMQKAAMAGIPIVAAVGAPSTLAVEIAREFDITVAGFVRDGRLNVYHGEWRLTHGHE